MNDAILTNFALIDNRIDCICTFFFYYEVYLDGLKPKEELLAAVRENVFQEVDRLRGRLQ